MQRSTVTNMRAVSVDLCAYKLHSSATLPWSLPTHFKITAAVVAAVVVVAAGITGSQIIANRRL